LASPTRLNALRLNYLPAFEVAVFELVVFELVELVVLVVAVFAPAPELVPAPDFAVWFVEVDSVATVFFGDAETSPFLSTTTTWKEFVPPGLSETFIDAAADAGTVLTRIPLR